MANRSPNDNRSDAMNPNNSSYKASIDNRSTQLNPNNARSERGNAISGGGCQVDSDEDGDGNWFGSEYWVGSGRGNRQGSNNGLGNENRSSDMSMAGNGIGNQDPNDIFQMGREGVFVIKW